MTHNEVIRFTSQKAPKILVLGDVMLDRYVFGDVTRMSPEAPVPVLDVKTKESRVGGAANVALNLRRLGADIRLCGYVGKDLAGDEFFRAWDDSDAAAGISKIHRYPVRQLDSVSTVTKTRFITSARHMLRVDEPYRHVLPAEEDRALLNDRLKETVESFDADVVVISEYNKGYFAAVSDWIDTCRNAYDFKRVPLIIDCKPAFFSEFSWRLPFAHTYLPNRDEATYMGMKLLDLQSRDVSHEDYEKSWEYMLVTCGADGMSLWAYDDGPVLVCTHDAIVKHAVDPTGAGDTVTAAYAYAIAKGLAPSSAAQIANMAAAQVVQVMGTSVVNSELLCQAVFDLVRNHDC